MERLRDSKPAAVVTNYVAYCLCGAGLCMSARSPASTCGQNWMMKLMYLEDVQGSKFYMADR